MSETTRNDMFLITPMSQHFALNPGETYRGTIKVVNPANSTREFKYVVGTAPYGVIGEDYDADLTTNTAWNKIAEWIEIKEPKGTLEPNETRDVEFTIVVPENAPVGAQSAAIVVTQDKEATGTEGVMMDNVFEMASIIYADILGEVSHAGEILGNEIPFFSDSPKVVVETTVDNHGNVFEEATIGIKVKNLISGETILPTEANDGVYTDIVVPETTRVIRRNIDGLPFLGVVRVEQAVYYNGHSSIESRDILICPIWFMFLVVTTVFLIVWSFIKLHKLRRRKKGVIV